MLFSVLFIYFMPLTFNSICRLERRYCSIKRRTFSTRNKLETSITPMAMATESVIAVSKMEVPLLYSLLIMANMP